MEKREFIESEAAVEVVAVSVGNWSAIFTVKTSDGSFVGPAVGSAVGRTVGARDGDKVVDVDVVVVRSLDS